MTNKINISQGGEIGNAMGNIQVIICRFKGEKMHNVIPYTVDGNGCWIVDSVGCDSNGYPVVTVNCKQDRAHRHAYELAHGEIPKGKIIRHACDNRKCINPTHLLIGEHKDNVADRVARNRSATGVDNGRAKLTVEDVMKIFSDNSSPKMHLAKHFGVDPKVIRDIKQRKTWKRVTKCM